MPQCRLLGWLWPGGESLCHSADYKVGCGLEVNHCATVQTTRLVVAWR